MNHNLSLNLQLRRKPKQDKMGVNMRHVVNQLKCVEIKGWIPKTPKLLSKVGVVTSKES